jgi:hypothetical protein
LEENFVEELKTVDKAKMKEWYNGYRWDSEGDTVYNPFSTLSFFSKRGKFENFWYATGTPTFLMELCKEQHFYKFDEISINAGDVGNFDIENLQIIPILFQTGYLTIKSEHALLRNLKLSFPNLEVKESYLRNLADTYIGSTRNSAAHILEGLLRSLEQKDKELLKATINHAFAQLPYDLWQKENEKFYHAIVHLMFSLLGVYIQSEVHTKKGRADALVELADDVYCLEFKLDQSADEALLQIEDRAYTERFKNNGKTIHHIGINFSSINKEVEEVKWVFKS